MILLIDNYDSFVHNLGRYFCRLGHVVKSVRNDAINVATIREWAPHLVVLSPGPCTPREAGCCKQVVSELTGDIPILGVCLGHQAIAEGLGGHVIRADEPVHGRGSWVSHDGRAEFENLPNPFFAARYHSLVVSEDKLPNDLLISARTSDGTVMGIRHRGLPVFGWQFHPESVLTEVGFSLLANLLTGLRLFCPSAIPPFVSERPRPVKAPSKLPVRPVTF